MISVNFNAAALNGHTGHSDDIIAPNEFVPAGLHWNPAQGYASCGVVVTPPGEDDHRHDDEPPVADEPRPAAAIPAPVTRPAAAIPAAENRPADGDTGGGRPDRRRRTATTPAVEMSHWRGSADRGS